MKPDRVWQRSIAFFRKGSLDLDFQQEMDSHLAFAIEENMRKGMNGPEARRQALIRFGGMEQMQEQHRETRGMAWLDALLQDVNFSLRTLRKDIQFALVAVLILAIGIGANVVVFSVVNALLLRPLPFEKPEQLVWIAPEAAGGLSSATYSSDAYEQLVQQSRSFQGVTGYYAFSTPDNLKLMGGSTPIPATGMLVAENFFSTLGVKPYLGHLFTRAESVHGAPTVMLLSYAYWQRQFNGDPLIVGRVVDFNKTPVTITGILPKSFDFGAAFMPGRTVDAFQPVVMEDISSQGNTLSLIGRLKPDVTVAQAQAEASTLFPKLLFSFRQANSAGSYKAHPVELKQYISGKLRRSLIMLWCAVGLILLIVCVNLSNLLLARAAARNKEFALRTALGASHGRLIRQVLTESFVLSAIGALGGLIAAFALTSYIAHQTFIALPLLNEVRVDGGALAWTIGLMLVTATLFGMVPALKVKENNLQDSLKDSGMGMSEGRGQDRLRSLLVSSEVALACVLLIMAGLLLRSFVRVTEINLGFQPETASSIRIDYPDVKLGERNAFFRTVQEKMTSIPGVESAGIADHLPFAGNRSWGSVAIKGVHYEKGELPDTLVYPVTLGYLPSIGMRLKGSDVPWVDETHKEKVIILNRSAADHILHGQDPINRMVNYGGDDYRVIGVVDDVHATEVEGKGDWEVFIPAYEDFGDAQLVVRSKLPASTLGPTVLSALRSINGEQAMTELRPIQGLVDHAVSPRKFFVLLVAVFAALGLLLASLGIFGVIQYNVTRQTKEIGIRMALGASGSKVRREVMLRTAIIVGYGIVAGLVASFLTGHAISSMLYQTEATDFVSFLGTAVLLTAVALLAGYLPARHASQIDPMQALRTN